MNRCPGNCLVHLHSAAGKDWLLRRNSPLKRYTSPDGIPRFVVPQDNNEPVILSSVDISTMHFLHKKATLESVRGCPVQNILVILPASNNTPQYQSQLSAAAAAVGIHILLFIERPVLAAAYYDSLTAEQKTVLVFELGDRRLEISLITEDLDLNVKAAVSDLGCPLFHFLVSELSSRLEFDFTGDAKSLVSIQTECERAKDALCLGSDSVELKFGRLGREVTAPISRASLVEMNFNLLRSGIMRCLTEAGVEQEAVDEVVLAGASTNIPEVRAVLREFFQGQPFRCEIDPANLIMSTARQYIHVLSDLADVPVAGLETLNIGLLSV